MARKKTDQKETVKPSGVFGSAPDAVERIGGADAEIMPEEIETDDILPHDIKKQIDDAIYDFMTYECKPPIEDMSKARQPRWSACCMYIGQRVNKKLIRPQERRDGGKWTAIETDIVNAIIPLWLFYCSIYDKTPLKADFIYFSGLSWSWLYDNRADRVTPERVDILQKLHKIQEHGIKGIITDGRSNPTGNIVILNHDHGYATSTVTIQHETKQAISAVQLPKLSDNSTPG